MMHFDFLVCSERSGSNLITKMMNANSETCGPFPSHMFRQFALNYYRYGDLGVDGNWKTFLADVVYYMDGKFAEWDSRVTVEHIESAVNARTLAEVGRVCYETEARAHGKRRLFVKENHSYSIADYLLSHFPDARFVTVVRDPRDMAATWKKLAFGGVKRGAKQWQVDQRGSIDLHARLRDIGRSLLVTFEGLVLDAETELRRACGFFEVEFEAGMLEFHSFPIVGQNAQKMVSWRDLQKPLQPGEVGKYGQELSEAEIRYVELVCSAEMAVLGYRPDFEPTLTVEELELQLPPAFETDRQHTDVEKAAYARFHQGIDRIQGRELFR